MASPVDTSARSTYRRILPEIQAVDAFLHVPFVVLANRRQVKVDGERPKGGRPRTPRQLLDCTIRSEMAAGEFVAGTGLQIPLEGLCLVFNTSHTLPLDQILHRTPQGTGKSKYRFGFGFIDVFLPLFVHLNRS